MSVGSLTLQLTDYRHTPLAHPVFSSFWLTKLRTLLQRKLTYSFCASTNTFNNFNISTIYMCNIYVKLTIDNTTTAHINYKKLDDCKWDPMTLTNNILYTLEFTFL